LLGVGWGWGKTTNIMKISRTLENSIYFGTEIPIIDRANALRKEMTDAEQALWSKIRKRQLLGYKFRRQHPIKQFIADFYCHERKLVIEVDGGYHNEPTQAEHDQQRTYELEKMGIQVLRFKNEEIMIDMEGVIEKIRKLLTSHGPHPSPPQSGRE
jgi:very-short-patch-repair endonuclease